MRAVIIREANGWAWKVLEHGRTIACGWTSGGKSDARAEVAAAMSRASGCEKCHHCQGTGDEPRSVRPAATCCICCGTGRADDR